VRKRTNALSAIAPKEQKKPQPSKTLTGTKRKRIQNSAHDTSPVNDCRGGNKRARDKIDSSSLPVPAMDASHMDSEGMSRRKRKFLPQHVSTRDMQRLKPSSPLPPMSPLSLASPSSVSSLAVRQRLGDERVRQLLRELLATHLGLRPITSGRRLVSFLTGRKNRLSMLPKLIHMLRALLVRVTAKHSYRGITTK